MHEVLVNRLGGISLPKRSVVMVTDCPDMTTDVYPGSKTTTQQQLQTSEEKTSYLYIKPLYTGGLCILESICHFRGVRSILSLLFYF